MQWSKRTLARSSCAIRKAKSTALLEVALPSTGTRIFLNTGMKFSEVN
jgi:hypothetical protein